MNSDHNPDQENGSTDSLDNLLDSVRNHLGATPESAADLDEEIPLLTEVVVPATGTQPPPHDMITRSALIEPELPAPEEDPARAEGNPHWGSQGKDHENAADDWLDETVLSTTIDIARISASDTAQNPDNEQAFDIDLEMAAETTRLEDVDGDANWESPAVNISAPEDADQQTIAPEPDDNAFPHMVNQGCSTGDSQTPSSQTPSLTDSSTENYEPVETSMESTPHALAGLETQPKQHPEGSLGTTAHQTDTVATDDLSLCLEQLEQLIDHRCSRLANELKSEVRQLFTDFPTD